MKRGNIRTHKIYTKDENGNKVIKYAVEVRIRGKKEWVQARSGENVLVFDDEKAAEKIIIDLAEEAKKTLSDKMKEGKTKIKFGRK